VTGLITVNPDKFKLPELKMLEEGLPALMESVADDFSQPRITEVVFPQKKQKTKEKK
ncbi:MAG: hypothetical protein IH899_21745, partial [Planctomycetes bacterium]|nr:hypothetical protein [Planctomycetota bacterium]